MDLWIKTQDKETLLKVNKVELFYSIDGLFTNSTKYQDIVGNNYDLNDNLILTAPSIEIATYYNFFLNTEEVEVVLIGSDRTEYTTTVTIGTYTVCYRIDGKIHNSGYQLTLNE